MRTVNLKFALLGDSLAGKSNLLRCYNAPDGFNDNLPATIGQEFEIIQIENNNIIYRICVWDTPGCAAFDLIKKSYIPASELVILCFDAKNPESKLSIEDFAAKNIPYDKPIIVAGLKDDGNQLGVGINQLDIICGGKTKTVPYISCSAKKYLRVEAVFDLALQTYLKANAPRLLETPGKPSASSPS